MALVLDSSTGHFESRIWEKRTSVKENQIASKKGNSKE
jgi:hypothetical protein